MELVLAERHRLWEGKPLQRVLFASSGEGRALVITGPFLRRSALWNLCSRSLREEGLLMRFRIFVGPPTAMSGGAWPVPKERCGTIVACGGRAIDVAKAVSLLDNGRAIGITRAWAGAASRRSDHRHSDDSGSGSEVRNDDHHRGSRPRETARHFVTCRKSPSSTPADIRYASPALTAATGVDALTHAIESTVSRKATKLTIDFPCGPREARQFLPVAFASPMPKPGARCLLGSRWRRALPLPTVPWRWCTAWPAARAKFGIHGVSNAICWRAIMVFASAPQIAERYAGWRKRWGQFGETPSETARAELGV